MPTCHATLPARTGRAREGRGCSPSGAAYDSSSPAPRSSRPARSQTPGAGGAGPGQATPLAAVSDGCRVTGRGDGCGGSRRLRGPGVGQREGGGIAGGGRREGHCSHGDPGVPYPADGREAAGRWWVLRILSFAVPLHNSVKEIMWSKRRIKSRFITHRAMLFWVLGNLLTS